MSRLLHHQLGDERYPSSLPDNPQPQPKLHQTQPLPPKGQKRADVAQIRNKLCQTDHEQQKRPNIRRAPPNPTLANGAQASCIHT